MAVFRIHIQISDKASHKVLVLQSVIHFQNGLVFVFCLALAHGQQLIIGEEKHITPALVILSMDPPIFRVLSALIAFKCDEAPYGSAE